MSFWFPLCKCFISTLFATDNWWYIFGQTVPTILVCSLDHWWEFYFLHVSFAQLTPLNRFMFVIVRGENTHFITTPRLLIIPNEYFICLSVKRIGALYHHNQAISNPNFISILSISSKSNNLMINYNHPNQYVLFLHGLVV